MASLSWGLFKLLIILISLDLLISTPTTPSLGVLLFFLSLTLSVCPSVCLSQTLLLLFCFSMESSQFLGHQFYMTKTTKRCSSIFDLGPLMPKIYCPRICTKSSISWLVWQIDWRCLGLLGGLWDG